jgi:tetratricopeptide (TPR) repeat protein
MGTQLLKTTLRWIGALAVAVVLVGTAPDVSFAQDKSKKEKEAEKPQPSKAARKPLSEAQKLMEAKKWPEMIVKLQEVEAMPGKTPYDDFLMNEMFGYAYAQQKDYPNAVKYLEGSFNSGFAPQEELPNRIRQLAGVNYQIKNYEKAIEYGTKALDAGYGDAEYREMMFTVVSQAYYIKEDYKNTQSFTEKYVQSQLKNNETPKEQTLQLILGACAKLDDAACQTTQFERLATYYPKPEYWQNLLYSIFQAADHTDKSLLQTYRLMSEVDVLKRSDDYTEMAQLAIEQGSPGEAVAILEKGFAKKAFVEARDVDRNKRLLESAKKQADADKASLGRVDADAAASSTGVKDVGVGLAWLSYKEYDKAVTALQRGLGKPGVKDEAEARLLLGIAQLGAGKKEDAQATFKAVKGDAKMERIANLWGLRARQV